MQNPELVLLNRGALPESIHCGAFAVAGPDGSTLAALGDILRPVFPRSAVKALQAIALVETGAADAFRLNDAELAIACASHGGEPVHVDTVRRFLDRTHSSPGDLACGAHWPSHEESARKLFASGKTPDALHNNCSGKHAGMLALARHLGAGAAGYELPDHPVQQRIREIMAELTGTTLDETVCAIDGCSVPTWAMPLEALARAFARFAGGEGLGRVRAGACARLRAACFAEPMMVAGSGRFCTTVMERLKGRAFVKTGAEGVFCAALPDRALGVALKIDDGAKRASEAVMAGIVAALVDGADVQLGGLCGGPLRNWRGTQTGTMEFSSGFRQALTELGQD